MKASKSLTLESSSLFTSNPLEGAQHLKLDLKENCVKKKKKFCPSRTRSPEEKLLLLILVSFISG